MIRSSVVWILFLVLSFSPYTGGDRTDLLAPQSSVVFGQEVSSVFNQYLIKLEELKQEVLAGKRPEKESFKTLIEAFVEVRAKNRDEFLQGRKMLGWWLYYAHHFELFTLRYYIDVLEKANEVFEEKYFSQIPEEVFYSGALFEPEWDEQVWDDSNLHSVFVLIYQVAARRELIHNWLIQDGVMVKALHLIHGVSYEEIQKAIDENDIFVDINPEGHGAFKYVLKVKVTLGGKDFFFAFNGFQPSSGGLKFENELNALNLLTGPRVPLLGAVNLEEKVWLEEYIFGRHPVDFVVHYASLKDENDQKLYSSEDIAAIWKSVQTKAANQYLKLFLKDFGATTFVADPHLLNVKVTWSESQRSQIDLAEIKVFDLGNLDRPQRLRSVIVDVGTLEMLTSQNAWFHFETVYNHNIEVAQDALRLKLPEISFNRLPSKFEFFQNFYQDPELTDQDRQKLLLLLMPYLQNYQSSMLLFGRKKESLKDNSKIVFYKKLEEFLYKRADREIFSYLNQRKAFSRQEIQKIKETWEPLLILAHPKNSEILTSDVDGMLQILAESAASYQIRTLANQLHFERTGEYAVAPIVLELDLRGLEAAI